MRSLPVHELRTLSRSAPVPATQLRLRVARPAHRTSASHQTEARPAVAKKQHGDEPPSGHSPDPKPEAPGTTPGTTSDEESSIVTDPILLVCTENVLKGLLLAVAAGILGKFLDVDPWAFWVWDASAVQLALLSCIPAAAAVGLLLARPSLLPPVTNREELQLLSQLEDDVSSRTEIVVNLDMLLGTDTPATATEDEPVAATTNPTLSGLRLLQIWITKPFYPQFSPGDAAKLLSTTSLVVAGNEMLVRGLCVAVLAGLTREAVAAAGQDSVLFWGKLLRLNGPDLYRWVACGLVLLLSVPVIGNEADRVQSWARRVLYSLAAQDKARKGSQQQQQGSAGGSSDSSSSTGLGLSYTGENLRVVPLAVLDGKVVEVQDSFLQVDALRVTQEDVAVRSLVAGLNLLQAAQLAALYGATGSLWAPFSARLLLDLLATAAVTLSAQNGAPSLDNMVRRSAEERQKLQSKQLRREQRQSERDSAAAPAPARTPSEPPSRSLQEGGVAGDLQGQEGKSDAGKGKPRDETSD